MRVLVLSDCPFIPNSLGKIIRYISAGLMDAGYDVYNVCPAAYTTLDERFTRYVWRGHEFRCYPWSGTLKPYRERPGFDIVLLFGTPYSPPLNEALRECYEEKYRCIGYFDSESIWLIPEYGLHAANTVLFATPSKFVLSTFIESLRRTGIDYGVLRERTRVVYHGVDAGLYRGGERLLPGDKIVYGFFGKNHVRKDVSVLIDAYARACVADKGFCRDTALYLATVGFAGDGSWNIDLLIRLAETRYGLDMRGKVYVLTDHESRVGVPEQSVAKIYRSIDVFVFPSSGEAFGLPPLEYLAGGAGPVIVTRHPVLKEIWGDVVGVPEKYIVDGWEFTVGDALVLLHPDPEHMSNIMLELYRDSGRARWLRSIEEKALGIFPVDRMVDGIVRMVEEADGFDGLISDAGSKK